MKNPELKLATVAALVLTLSSGAWAQAAAGGAASAASASAGSDSRSASLSADDRNFVMHAAMGGMAEVRLGELAQRQAASDEVKQFGAQMVKDHGAANDELLRIASSKGLQPPAQLDAKHAQLVARLEKLQGADFDREYVRAMRDDHKKDVAEFEHHASSARDADVKAFAQKTLPTLRQHLTRIQGINPAGASGRS